jgi:hypothetical protein
MGATAKLTSTDALTRLKLALQYFHLGANDGLTAVAMEVQRFIDWVEHDRAKFWAMKVRKGFDKIAEARSNLERCQMMNVAGHTPECRDEKKALERAKRELAYAEEKVAKVKHWSRALRHEATEYQARAGQLTGWLEGEFPKAVAALERMIAAIENYLAVTAPQGRDPSAATSDAGQSMAQPISAAMEQMAAAPAEEKEAPATTDEEK